MQSAVRTRVLIFSFLCSPLPSPLLFSSSFLLFPLPSSLLIRRNPCADIFGFGVGGCFGAVGSWVVSWLGFCGLGGLCALEGWRFRLGLVAGWVLLWRWLGVWCWCWVWCFGGGGVRVFNVSVLGVCVCVSACRVVAGVCWRLWSCWLVCGGSEGIDILPSPCPCRVRRITWCSDFLLGVGPVMRVALGAPCIFSNVGLQAQP